TVRGFVFPFEISVRSGLRDHPYLLFIAGVLLTTVFVFLVRNARLRILLMGSAWIAITMIPILRTMSPWSLYIPSIGYCLAFGHLLTPRSAHQRWVATLMLVLLLTAYTWQLDYR